MLDITQDDKSNLALLASRLDQLIGGITKIGVAYIGFKAAKHWSGALTTLVALELAKSGNLAAGTAGVAVLTYAGLTQIVPPVVADVATGLGLVTTVPR